MIWKDRNIVIHAHLLNQSFLNFTGKELLDSDNELEKFSEKLYHAPFVVVSHGIQPDPVFNYANKTAQEIWGYSWDEFTSLPSRLSAETEVVPERQKMLEIARLKGYFEGYSGIRITKNGKRFVIKNAVLWNVMDGGRRIGQAAAFSDWEYLTD